jgi:hypothetical protein
VADNGGLLIATGDPRSVIVAVRPSQLLKFTPLAVSSDHGSSYSPALLPDEVAATPDALASSSAATGSTVALTGSEALTSPPGLANWQPFTSFAALRAGAGASCGLQQLTAVAVTAGARVVAGDCEHTTVAGVFAPGLDGGYHLAGPAVPVSSQASAVEVLRLVPYQNGLAVLLGRHPGPHPSYQAAWEPTLSGAWSLGPEMASGPLVSTSVMAGGGFAIVTEGTSGNLNAAVISPGLATWQSLPAPPARTSVVSVMSGRTDAMAVDGSSFQDFQLSGSGWRSAGPPLKVPIDYGSSG